MARTAPVPNIPAIPGMNPGVFIMGGGGTGGGGGGGSGNGSKNGQGADGKNGGDDATGGGKSACGSPGMDGGGCPRHHGGGNSGASAQGDPIDVVTGRVFTRPVVDLKMPGPLPLVMRRSYATTSCERDIGLGYGWTHTFAWQVEMRGRRAVVWTEDGLPVPFGVVEPGAGVAGPHGWVLHRHEEGFALDVPDGTRRIFQPDTDDPTRRRLRLAAVEDRARNRIELVFSGSALSRIVDSVGRTTRVSVTREGRLAALDVVCPSGRVLRAARYDYDSQGRLVGVLDADGHATTYDYDEDNRLISYRLPTGLVFFFRYDAKGRGVETWGEYTGGVDVCLADDLPDVLRDGRTKARGIHHIKIEYGDDGYSEAVDSMCAYRYFGNAHGKLDKAVVNGCVYSRTYDARGHLTSYTDALGAITRWERDIFGNETRVIDALGHVTCIERLPNGDVARITDPGGGETEISYTSNGVAIKDPIGAIIEVRYDSRGLPIETIAPNGRRRLYRYDDHGNPVQAADESSVLWRATYDELGRCTSVCDQGGGVTRYSYSGRGLLLSREEPGGLISRYEYDGLGNLIEAIDPSGRRTVLVRGGSGSLAEAHLPDGTAVRLRYDRSERLIRIENARGEVYSIELGPTGLKKRERTFDGREISYEHDLEGRIVRAVFSSGDDVRIERDLLGNIVKRTRADGSDERFEHDFRGEIISAETAASRVELTRNAIGWIVSERQIIDGVAFEVEVAHDDIGMPVRLKTSLGYTTEWRRDYTNRTFELLLDGAEGAIARFDASGREIERVLSRGGRMSFRYDAAGNLVARRVTSPSLASGVGPLEPEWVGERDPSATIDQRLSYNAASELVTMWDARFGVTRYDYDAVGQIIAAVPEDARAELFAYDAAGNVHDVSVTAERREYGRGDILMRSGATEFQWDDLGRLVQRRTATAQGQRVTSYRWTAAGTLSRVVIDDEMVVEFTYDAFARRMKKDVYRLEMGGGRSLLRRTRFHWHGSTLLHDITEAEGHYRERRYHFDEAGEPWAHREISVRAGQRNEGAWIFYVNDLAGFPERLVDGEGRVLGELRRNVWGVAVLREGSGAGTPFRFLGQYEDEETGLFYNRYRYYDPAAGRYISPDPLDLLGGLNAFVYAKNNTLFFGDPFGLVYTRIVDNSTSPATVLHEGFNPEEARGRSPEHGGQIPQTFTSKPCAETQALQRMKNQITDEIRQEQAAAKKKGNKRQPFKPMTESEIEEEATKRTKAKFNNPNISIETFQEKDGPAVDPCPSCGEMFRTLGIGHAVVGAKGKRGQYGVYKKPPGY